MRQEILMTDPGKLTKKQGFTILQGGARLIDAVFLPDETPQG
ncbi:MAG: hypothetical protein ACRD22_22860 [Terriglobia bacterium]